MQATAERKEVKLKETVTAYDQAQKKHMDIQSKETRKRLKKDRKQAAKWMKKNVGKSTPCKNQ